MAYYVDGEGEVFTFRIKQPMKIELSNGVVLNDPPPGRMFAVERSAKKYARLLKEENGNAVIAAQRHQEWVRNGSPDDYD